MINLQEFLNETDPDLVDTDGDGLGDGFEFIYNFDPLDPSEAGDDADNDGVSNLREYLDGTNPLDDSSGNSQLDLSNVNLADLVIAERINNGTVVPAAALLNHYDINNDGVVGMSDIVLLRRARAGL